MLVALPLLLACARAPDPCTDMCGSAATLYGGCLESWGLGWSAAGYADQADFLDRCQTWAWEERLLEARAVRQGQAGAEGSVDATCTERDAAFTAAAADPEALQCAVYTDIAWDEAPWETP